MKILDTHADIFSNLHKHGSETDPFYDYHFNALQKGMVVGGIWVIYSDSDFDVVSAYQMALEKFKQYENDYLVVKGLEGLRNVPDLKTFKVLYDLGIRHASLTWNEQNHLAAGAKALPNLGVTPLGFQFLAFMNENKMIVDVSHLNEQSFYDVLSTNPPLLIASHSNAFELCPHVRNLKKEQLIALKAKNGKVGVVAARNFVSSNPDKQNIEGFVDHLDYMVEIMGIDNVMLGLDMMNYLNEFSNSNLDDLKSHEDLPLLIDALYKRGYNEEAITKICYLNCYELIKQLS